MTAVHLAQLRLLQLSSPLLPIGAFAYSQALEQAAALGWVTQADDLQQWLAGLLHHNLARTDLPLLALAHTAWSEHDAAAANKLAERVLALRESQELRAEEQRLGSALARVLSNLNVPAAATFVGSPNASYVALYGLAAAHYQIPVADALGGFAFAWLENQVSAACRVLALGQLKAQAVLSAVLTGIPDAVHGALQVPHSAIGACAPAFAVASAWHEEQYSRLFRS